MAAHKKSQTYLLVAAIAAGMGLWLGPVVIGERSSLREWFLLGAAVTAFVTALLYTLIMCKSFNFSSQAKRDAVAQAVAEGSVVIEQEGAGKMEETIAPRTPRVVPLLVTVAWLAAFLIPVPLVLRLINDWHVNPQVKPAIAGPGDTVRVELPDEIRSADGRWRATPTVVIENAGELGVEPNAIQATSKDDAWGVQFRTRSKPSEYTSKLWADLQLPDDPKLAGQTLQLRIQMEVAYPTLSGPNTFDHKQTTVTSNLQLQTAKLHAAKHVLWGYMVAVVGIAGMILAGCALVLVSRRVERGFPNGTFEVLPKLESTDR